MSQSDSSATSTAMTPECEPRPQPIKFKLKQYSRSLRSEEKRNDELVSLFECCFCFDHICPPIMQCSNGHLLCRKCRQMLDKCPNCEIILYDDIRCTSMEKMAKLSRLQFPCKYKRLGCSHTTLLRWKKSHEEQCQHRPYRCLDLYADHALYSCHWSGPRDLLVNHMMVSHDIPVFLLVDKLNIVCNVDNGLTHCLWETFIIHKQQLFLFKLAKKCTLYNCSIVFVGEEREAKHFSYRLQLDVECASPLQFEGRPKSSRDNSPSTVCDGLNFFEKLSTDSTERKPLEFTLHVWSDPCD